jgi:hypothetical protein
MSAIRAQRGFFNGDLRRVLFSESSWEVGGQRVASLRSVE